MRHKEDTQHYQLHPFVGLHFQPQKNTPAVSTPPFSTKHLAISSATTLLFVYQPTIPPSLPPFQPTQACPHPSGRLSASRAAPSTTSTPIHRYLSPQRGGIHGSKRLQWASTATTASHHLRYLTAILLCQSGPTTSQAAAMGRRRESRQRSV